MGVTRAIFTNVSRKFVTTSKLLSQGQICFDKDCNFILSIMEKKVESPKSSIKSVDSVQENLINGKEFVQLFQKMTVTREKVPLSTNSSTKSSTKAIIHRIHPSSRLKKKCKVTKKTSKVPSSSVLLRPSKLTHVVAQKTESSKASSSQAESRFIDFSADCSRELETILKDSSKSTTEEKDANSTKDNKRKTSCAQQARCEGLPSSDAVNLSIDILTDYLDEAILFPKKMSYMAELMYT